jgi:hypothetical protein
LSLVGALGLAACSSEPGEAKPLESKLGYDTDESRLVVIFNRDLDDGEELRARVRSLAEGDSLDCKASANSMPKHTQNLGDHVYNGPMVDLTMFDNPTSPETLLGETEEVRQQRLENTYFVDVCVKSGSGVAHQARYDIRQALDQLGSNGKFDAYDDGVRIVSNQAYAEACIAEMGDIPFWGERIGGGPGTLGVANEASFEVLNGEIGLRQDRAQAIIEHRNGEDGQLGTDDDRPFETLKDLQGIYGIGPASIEAIHDYAEANADELTPPDWETVDCLEIGTPIPSEVDGVPADSWVDKCDNPQQIYSHCEPDARTGANGPRVAHARNEEGSHWVLLCRKSHRETEGRYNDMAMIGHNPFSGQTCFFQNQLPSGETHRPSNAGMSIPHPADNVKSEKSPQMWSDLWGGIEGGIGPDGGIQCQGCHSTDPFVHTPWIDGAVDEKGNPIVPKMGQHPDFVEGYNGPYKLVDAKDQGWEEPKHLVSEEASSCTSCHRIGLDQWTSPSSNASRNNPDGGCVFCGQAPWLNRLERADTRWETLLTESHKTFEFAFWMPPNAHDVLNEELWADSEYKKAMDFIRHCGENPGDGACEWETLPKEPGDPTELPEVEETGVELAAEALAILGAPYEANGETHEGTRRCAECHATSRFGIRSWKERTTKAVTNGLDIRADVDEMSPERAQELVQYMRRDDNPESVFAAYKLGILAAGAQFPFFTKLFEKAYGADWGLQYGAFLGRVSMPKGSHPPLNAREFAVVAKWFIDEDVSHLNELLPEVPPPATCEEVEAQYSLTNDVPWLENHLYDMEFDGWGARNTENGINMFGCTGSDPLDCFDGDFTELADWKHESVSTSRVVEVRDLGFDTSYWMRSSADGRFVGNGGGSKNGFRATITDLVTGQDIGVRGSYDPGFFPNNDGFIMQGSGAGLCGQSVLTQADAIEDGIDFSEPGCTNAEGINLYQHVAVNTDGGDYFVINSEFTSDPGSASEDPEAAFYEGSTMKFSPMVFDGSDWTQKEAVVVDSPYEGDSVLSPSGKMVISRFAGPGGESLGYMIRKVDAFPNAQGSYDIDISQPVQFLCTPGAKANISFDERYSVTHHYEDDTANLYVTDILTGETHQVTDMPAKTFALFPHFRSDGWIYFLASGPDGDKAVATDAVLRLAQQ